MTGVFKATCPRCGQVTDAVAEDAVFGHSDRAEILRWIKQGKRVEYTTEPVTIGWCECKTQIRQATDEE
jgi:hypothetical protein